MFGTSTEISGQPFADAMPAMVHDLNNNLQMVVSALEMMQSRMRQGRPLETSHLEHALLSAERVASLGRRLMQRQTDDQSTAAMVDINSIIEKMQPIIGQIVAPSVAISLALAEDVGPISGERLDLENALLNLILNARDAMPAGGELTVRTSRLFIEGTSLPTGPYIAVAVADTGIGMSADVIRNAFSPYFTTKSPDRGTGLGLASVKAFVAAQGGDIEAQSVLGEGTTITIYIPEGPRRDLLPKLPCGIA